MGLTEVILEHVSLKTLPLVGIALWGLWMAMNRIKEHRRIKSIGSYTCSLHPRLPFGNYGFFPDSSVKLTCFQP